MQRPALLAFILPSVLLSFLVGGILAGVYLRDRHEFELELTNQAERARAAFDLAVAHQERQMLTLAALVANSPRVQQLFGQVGEAVAREGENSPRAAQLRTVIYQEVEPAWRALQQQFGLRQLHFFLAPGALSFLRVHLPEKFGDRIDHERPLIVDVNRDHKARSGYETGRVYSGIRGIVPVWSSRADGSRFSPGAIEVGGAFDIALSVLDRQLDSGFAVLMDQQHVDQIVWQDNRNLAGEKFDNQCQCYLEATTRPEIRAWLKSGRLPPYQGKESHHQIDVKDQTYQILRFPLRDYLGTLDSHRPAVGSVLVWHDITENVQHLRHKTQRNLVVAGLFLLAAELMIFYLLRLSRSVWQRQLSEATAALQDREERLDLAIRGADLGVWDWNLPSGKVQINDRWASMLGFRVDELPLEYSTWSERVHPDDWPAIEAVLLPHLRGESPIYEVEHRLRHKDGHWVWVLSRGRVIERDAEGQAIRAAGTHLDITLRKENELALAARRLEIERLSSRYRMLLVSAGEGILGIDTAGKITFVNPAALKMLDFELDELIGQDGHAMVHHHYPDGRAYPTEACPITMTLQDGHERHQEDWLIKKDGTGFPVDMTIAPIQVDGNIEGVVTIFQDIQTRRQTEQEMLRLATTDALTGIANRRAFIEAAEKELERVRRFSQSAALLMMDLDFFKTINDTYGHAAGDAALRHFATLCKDSLRRVDLFGRVGGEEFAVLLTATEVGGAREFAERIRQRQADTPLEFRGQTIHFTVSIGITLLAASDTALDNTFVRADRALYQAKALGRNRVEEML